MGNTQIKLKYHDFPFHIEKSGNPIIQYTRQSDRLFPGKTRRTERSDRYLRKYGLDPIRVRPVEWISRSEHDPVPEISVGNRSGHRNFPTECQPRSYLTSIKLKGSWDYPMQCYSSSCFPKPQKKRKLHCGGNVRPISQQPPALVTPFQVCRDQWEDPP